MSRIIVALDGMKTEEMFNLANELRDKVWGFKVNDAILEGGVKNLEWLKDYGNIFLDPKLHDIPNTVKNQVRRMVDVGADLITCHTSGGLEMLQAAVEIGGDRILGVTVLTSLSDSDMYKVYGGDGGGDLFRLDLVAKLASIAQQAACWGIVCAPTDLAYIPSEVRTVTPGFRPKGLLANDDQKHVGGADDAKKATLIVIGRPITQAENPSQAAGEINAQLEVA